MTGESSLPSIDFKAVIASAPSRRKFRLWWVPEENETISAVCGHIIGQGHAFCTNINCTVNHRQQRVCPIFPNEVYVQKTNDTAFIWPSIVTTSLTQDILNAWETETHTLEDWIHVFDCIKDGTSSPQFKSDEDVFSSDDLKTRVKYEKEVLAFKTPRPKKRKADITTDTDNVLPSKFKNLFEDIKSEEELNQTSTLGAIFRELDSRSISLLDAFKMHVGVFKKENSISMSCHQNVDARLNKLKLHIGERPTGMDEQFEAPTLWLTLASIASEMKLMMEVIQKENNILQSNWKSLELNPPLSSNDFTSRAAPLAQKIKEIEQFTVNSVQMLSQQMNFSNHPSASMTPASLMQSADFIARDKVIFDKIQALESEVATLRSVNDTETIKFSNLGFRNKHDCDAWVAQHHPGADFGLVMDFHLVMAHVHHAISGVNLIDTLSKVYKMDLSHNHQAVSLASYASIWPKYFITQSSGYNIIRKDESYFTAIKSWDDWDLPNDGYRDRLDKFLSQFEEGFARDLDAAVAPNSLFHTVASKALTNSVHWVRGLSKFLDDTYNEYQRAHYSGKTAWHITTRLALALIEYVGISRNTIHNTFRIDQPEEIAKSMFYAAAQALDRMAEVSSQNFKNSPVVMGELTKFLALNSNYELVGKLHSRLNDMKSNVDEALKESAANAKASSTLASKFETHLKRPLEALTKRVDKLEK